MKYFKQSIIAILIFVTVSFSQSDVIKIATYNLLRFPEVSGAERVTHFQTVMNAMRPDILVVQEMQSQAGVDLFVNQIINNPGMSGYKAAPFVDGYDTDNALFYNSAKIEFVRNRQILTWLREVSEYTVKYKPNPELPQLKIFSLHLKAGNTADDRGRRLKDAQVIRGELNKLAAGSYFIVAGDFNLYGASEPAYQELIGTKDNNNGRCFDPVDKPGEWHNNSAFAMWHTQSTRTSVFGDGTAGGMDDRFDFILLSEAFFDSSSFLYIKDSYHAFGNDGLHFNYSINAAFNRAVTMDVANALYQASDHLPVCLEIGVMTTTGVRQTQGDNVPTQFSIEQNYPNPFNGSTTVGIFSGSEGEYRISIYDMTGRQVLSQMMVLEKGMYSQFTWDGKNSHGQFVHSGLYLLTVSNGAYNKSIKLVYLK